MIEHSIPKEK